MVLFIASEIMFFAAFFWMFFEMAVFNEARAHIPEISGWADTAAAWSTWPPKGVEVLDPWQLPLLNTVILLLSGTTVTWAHHALQVGDRKGAKMGLIITVALGVLFTAVQAYEYQPHHPREPVLQRGGHQLRACTVRSSSWRRASMAFTF